MSNIAIPLRIDTDELIEHLWFEFSYDEAVDFILSLDATFGDVHFTRKLIKALKKVLKED